MPKIKLHFHVFTKRNAILVGHYNDDAEKMCRCGEVRHYSRPRKLLRITFSIKDGG